MKLTTADYISKKIIFDLILLLLLITGAFNYQHIWYGLGQARGQLEVIRNARPVEEFLNDPQFPDSLKEKLILIQEVRTFAVDSLGVNDTKNYTTLYDQQGQPILWAVNASLPYKIEAYEWCFPIAGCFPYKGYFNMEKAEAEQNRLMAMGYDTYLRSVDGWSTLGFFKDPILSNMLIEDEGELAELIIHELTHATLYIKDSADYNENLATFVGNFGALEFLKYRFGENSIPYQRYEARLSDRKIFEEHILKKMKSLDSLYATFTVNQGQEFRDAKKNAMIREVFCSIDLSRFGNPDNYRWTELDNFTPNNAFFSQFLTYHEEVNSFEIEFRRRFDSDFKSYLAYLKETYGR